jgi:hypothetical protein
MHRTSHIRFNEIQHVLRVVPPNGEKFIIAGDWNENDGMQALAYCVLVSAREIDIVLKKSKFF